MKDRMADAEDLRVSPPPGVPSSGRHQPVAVRIQMYFIPDFIDF